MTTKPKTEGKHLVEVWLGEVGLPSTRYGSGKRIFSRAPIEALATFIEYPGIQISKITIRGNQLEIYRNWDDEWKDHSTMWTTDREQATRYARRRDGNYANTPASVRHLQHNG